MKVPAEFNALGSSFYAGTLDHGMSGEEWIDSRLAILKTHEKVAAKNFLDKLLAGKPDVKVLQDSWRSAGSNYCFEDAGIFTFLQALQKAPAK